MPVRDRMEDLLASMGRDAWIGKRDVPPLSFTEQPGIGGAMGRLIKKNYNALQDAMAALWQLFTVSSAVLSAQTCCGPIRQQPSHRFSEAARRMAAFETRT